MANRWTEKQFKAIRTNGCRTHYPKNHGRRWHRRGQNGRCNLYQGGGGGNEAENP